MKTNMIEAFSWNDTNIYFQEVFNGRKATIIDMPRYISKLDNIIFCPRSHIPYVCEKFKEPIVLVVASNMLCRDDDHILHKFKQHCIIDNEEGDMKVIQNFELGKNVHRIYATNCFIYDTQHVGLPYGSTSLLKYYELINKNIEPNKLCYVNFKIHSTGCETRKKIRTVLPSDIPIIKYKNNNKPETYVKYYNELLEHFFVASPEGTGPDCYRTWDSLYLNRYPIVDASNMTKHWTDLPIVRVDDWSKISSSFLNEELDRIKTSKFNLNKLDHKWWWEQIKQDAESIKGI